MAAFPSGRDLRLDLLRSLANWADDLALDKAEATQLLQDGIRWLGEKQDMLYAPDLWSLLLIFQAMDAAGKDSTIKHVMSGANSQGCQVFAFKQPSPEELDHDFMGATSFACRSADASVFSTAHTMRKSWYCAYIPRGSIGRSCRHPF